MRDDGKEGAAAIAPFFVERGYAVAGVSVRSSAQATFPAQLEDIEAAVRWLRGNAAEHGLDPDRIATMGNSSGGWVSVMAAVASREPVQAVVDFYGPTDFLQMDAHMPGGCVEFQAFLGIDGCHDDPGSPESRLVGGPIEERRDECAAANPIAHVGPGAPPMLILHGQADQFVPHHQSELLFAALKEHGNEATFYSLPGVKHEHPYVNDASRAEGRVVRETRQGEEHVVDAPPPTWETIERFVASALRR
jgi:acetyl esterase/lipase